MMAVPLQFGPAAAAVGDDKIHFVSAEDLDIAAGSLLQPFQIAGQHIGRSAADLVPGSDDLVAERGKQTDRGATGIAEDKAHDAAQEEADGPALNADRRGDLLYFLPQRPD